jgi:subtilase family serine protease
MKRVFVLSIGMSLLLAATLSLMAQAPDPHHIYAHAPVHIANVPANPSSPTGILPAQFKAAYGFNRIPNQGQGQTIALIDAYDDPNIASDLAFYANYFHLTPCSFQKVRVGNPQQGQGWDLEESLDVEQACALAPQANIILVEANSDSFSDLLDAVAVASSAPYKASVVSMSWGGAEFDGEQQDDSYFCSIVNDNGQPVTFVAAIGDACHAATYPAASPCVVTVGGTTLALSTPLPLANPLQLDYGNEMAYGGGGISLYESQPPWQNPACSQFTTSNRCVPDVASDANPATGVPVYDTYSYNGWVEVGGTSVATPDWASFFILVNSLRASQGESTLSQAAPDMYMIYYSNNYLMDFHDITSGECGAGPGYDLATGIGSYQTNNLVTPLVADPN